MRYALLLISLIWWGGLSGCGSPSSVETGQAGYSYAESAIDPAAATAEGDTGGKRTHNRYREKPTTGPGSEDWLTHFELIERSGKTIDSNDLKGQPYVVGFFFTLCPSICVNQNNKVQELQDKYRGQPIRFLSISCDPEVDRPPVLAEYAKRFNADEQQWLFLTGDMEYISRVAAEMYFLAAERRFHAEKFVLVDAEGKNVGFYTWSDPLQFKDLQRDIDKLLAEQ